MADRILTWHIPGVLSETGVVEANSLTEFTLDQDYVPDRVSLRTKTRSTGGACVIDINDDGASIFDVNPAIGYDLLDKIWTSFTSTLTRLKKDSVITLDIDQVSGITPGSDLTVQLELIRA